MKKRPTTNNQGANDERTAILAHVKRIAKRDSVKDDFKMLDIFESLIAWIENRSERYNKKAKGLGK